jgi:hypothetical protein
MPNDAPPSMPRSTIFAVLQAVRANKKDTDSRLSTLILKCKPNQKMVFLKRLKSAVEK